MTEQTSPNQPIRYAITWNQLDLGPRKRRNILTAGVEEIAIEKCRSSGHGITYSDIQRCYHIGKGQAQRSLKYFHAKNKLFTARDLTRQGVNLLKNTNPQEFFPTCRKGEIIENLKKRKHIHHEIHVLSTSFSSQNTSVLEDKKAENFLHALLLLPNKPPYIHKLQLLITIKKPTYEEMLGIQHNERRKRSHEEIVGRRQVKYLFSSNGTIEVFVTSNYSPFKIETDEDECVLFSFLGQVRDRLLYHVGDIKESYIPSVMDWILAQCDLNKDVEIDEKAQLTLPDIQLKSAERVFREYVKIMQGEAYYRVEESIKLNEVLLVALDNIRHPHKSVEAKVDTLTRSIKSLAKTVNQLKSQYGDFKIKRCGNEQVDNGEKTDVRRGGDP